MPVLASRGIMSATGFGQFLRPKALPMGTQGIFFKTGAQTSSINSTYNFATDSVTSAAGLSSNLGSYAPTASNRTLGLVSLSANTSNSSKYLFSSASSVAGPSLANPVVNSSAGTSIDATGLLCASASSGSTTTIVYTYSSDTTVLGGFLTANEFRGGATANQTYAIIGCGSSTKTTNKYTWSSNSASTATSFQTQTGFYSLGMSAGNANMGVFAQSSSGTNLTQKYTYAGEVTAITTGLTMSTSGGTGCGNDVKAVFSTGSLTNIYTYSSAAVSSGPALVSSSIATGTSMSNGIPGVTA